MSRSAYAGAITARTAALGSPDWFVRLAFDQMNARIAHLERDTDHLRRRVAHQRARLESLGAALPEHAEQSAPSGPQGDRSGLDHHTQ